MNGSSAPLPLPPFSRRALRWQLRTHNLTFNPPEPGSAELIRASWPPRPRLMGIVNVTPDSFSDGGQYFEPRRAVARALQLAAEGADILDIGGESTRPYSVPVAADEEKRRVLPVIDAVRAQSSLPISIDTSKASVAAAALEAGAEIINDVTGLTGDPDMLRVALEYRAAVCVMHMQGSPQTMQENPRYDDVVDDILSYLRQRRDELLAAGMSAEQICLDPGIGFGKTHQHNITLAAHGYRFHELGCPVLVGHSRKGFIAKVLGDKQTDRLAGTIGVAMSLALQGIQLLRVHDVGAVRQALLLFQATMPE